MNKMDEIYYDLIFRGKIIACDTLENLKRMGFTDDDFKGLLSGEPVPRLQHWQLRKAD